MVVPATILLRMDNCRCRLRDDGDRRERAHVILALAATSDRRVWLGSRPGGWRLFIWLSHICVFKPARRAHHGPTWPKGSHRNRCLSVVGWPSPGTSDSKAVATLRDARCHGWWGRQPHELYRTIVVSSELVCAPSRVGDQHCVRRCRSWGRSVAAVVSDNDHSKRLASVVPRDGSSCTVGPGAAELVRLASARRYRFVNRRGGPHSRVRNSERSSNHCRSGLDIRRVDAHARGSHRAVLVDHPRLLLRAFRLVCSAGSPDEISHRNRVQPSRGGLGARDGERHRHSRANRSWSIVRSCGAGMDLVGRVLWVCHLLRGADRT